MEMKTENTLEGWSEEDKAWLETLPVGIQPVGAKHGRRIFCLMIQAGQIGEQLAQLIRIGSNQTKERSNIIAGIVNQLAADYISMLPGGGEAFRACKEEFEREAVKEAPRIQLIH